ncbi:MAG: hypothetical protein WBA44_11645 [Mesorhizobium sp.]
MTDLQVEYDAAVAVRDEAQAELGEAILSGKDTAKLQIRLSEAEQAVLGLAMAREAVVAANQRAERRIADEAAAKRRAAIEKQWTQARTDHSDIVATAEALQRNFEKQKELVARLHRLSIDFVNNHRALGGNQNSFSVLAGHGWQNQMLLLMREGMPGMQLRLGKLHISASNPTKTISSCIPEFDRLLPPRARQEAA